MIRFGRMLHRRSCSHWVPVSEPYWPCPVTTSLIIIASSKFTYSTFSLYYVTVNVVVVVDVVAVMQW